MAEGKRRPRVLVIDDGEVYADTVAREMPEFSLVKVDGMARIADGRTAVAFFARKRRPAVDLVLLDMRFQVEEQRLLPLPGATPRQRQRFQGLAILREIRHRAPGLPVVVLTKLEDLDRAGLYPDQGDQSITFLSGGDDLEEMIGAGDLDLLRSRMHGALRQARQELDDGEVLWGTDPVMGSLRRRMAVLARTRTPVIVEGETGTGKSYMAQRFLHRNSGRQGPFVAADLATMVPDLIPAALFGTVRGGYTQAVDRKGLFEQAQGGTLFLDEIQNVPLEQQRSLLRVLQEKVVRRVGDSQERPVDVRVLVASNLSLRAEVAAGRFRRDLYMRLSPATRVEIPPLRQRLGDLHLLATRGLELVAEEADLRDLRSQVATAMGREGMVSVGLQVEAKKRLTLGETASDEQQELAFGLLISSHTWKQLEAHSWPGNMRELSNLMRYLLSDALVNRLYALEIGARMTSLQLKVDPGLVRGILADAAPASGHTPSAGKLAIEVKAADSLNNVSRQVERQYMRALFEAHGGDLRAMARALLGDPERARAVRLRLNQLGLGLRELRAG